MRGYSQDNPFSTERKLLGSRIKKWREHNDLTQESLAERAHVDVSYLAKIENGYVNTTIRYLVKISKGLGIKTRDLIDF